MAEEKIGLTAPEAALIMTVIVSLADDNPSEEETIVLRKYYRGETVETMQMKMETAGLKFPGDIEQLEPEVLEVLSGAEPAFRKRTLAVCLKLAEADGTVDQNEMNLLNRYCDHFKMTMFDVQEYGSRKLRELDEVHGYDDIEDLRDDEVSVFIDLTTQEAGIALVIWVAFSDDEPSEEEMAVVREFFNEEDVEGLIGKMKIENLGFPKDVPRLEVSIIKAFGKLVRDDQLRMLAIAYKTAKADGVLDPDEEVIIKDLCEEFMIGEGELKRFF